MSTRFRTYPRPSRPDRRSLTTRDRAMLRILNRSKAATCRQLSELTRAHLRKIQQRTLGLWQAGYVERMALAPPSSGRSPNAYRLSAPARRRLGYQDRRVAGINELQHRLDTTEAVCALARPCGPDRYPLQAWLTESMAADLLGPTPLPDSILVLQLATGSGVICIETDEATQHLPVMSQKLLAYRRALTERSGWHVLFVVPSLARLRWLRRRANTIPQLRGWASGWVVELAVLRRLGQMAPVQPIAGDKPVTALAVILSDPRRRECGTPVGSPEWLELLASGGGEELGGALE